MKHSGFAKIVACLLLAPLSMVYVAGCSQGQFDKTVTIINEQLPAAVALGQDLAALLNTPALGPEFEKLAGVVSADLPAFQQAVSAYVANKNSGTKNAIFSAVESLVGQVNAGFLQLNTVNNQKTQQAILTKVAAFAATVNGFQLVLAPFFNKSVQALNDYHTVAPFIPREVQQATARRYGTMAEGFGAAAGL